MIKRTVKRAVNILLGWRWVIRLGAQLPPKLKRQVVTKVCDSVRSSLDINEPILTNLGMCSGSKVMLPPYSPGFMLFGTPSQYRGERGALNLALILSSGCGVFLDIGANLGYFTYYLRANGANLPVHFFEPNPGLFASINDNVIQSDFLHDVTGHQLAMGDRCTLSKFYLNLTDHFSSSLEPYFSSDHDVSIVEVECTTLEAFVKKTAFKNICMKVDIEASEFKFLDGARGVLDDVSYLIIEILGPAIEQGFVKKLIEMGFNAYYINDFSLEYSEDGSFRYVAPEYNWLFCREDVGQLQSRLKGSTFDVH